MFSTIQAQTIDVVIKGTIGAVENGFNSNLIGTGYTFSFDIDSDVPEISSTSTSATYDSFTGFSDLTFGGNSYTSTLVQANIISNDPETGYGFNLSSNPDGGSDLAQLTGHDSNIAPTVALSSLHQVPLSEFEDRGTLGFVFDGGFLPSSPEFEGTIDSFSVTVPEPPTYAMMLGGLVALGVGLRRMRTKASVI